MYKYFGLILVSLFSLMRAQTDSVNIVIGTFLGNQHRNYYGNVAPQRLDLLWKVNIGQGKTRINSKGGEVVWKGCGWTGQPLLVEIEDTLYVIQGAFDHNLKLVNTVTQKIKWQYKFDDVIKGTGTIWENPEPAGPDEAYVILQGSRLGLENTTHSKLVPSFRGISLSSGEELWRLNVRKTRSYSRDVDGSALVLGDTVYIGLENSTFIGFDPSPANAAIKDTILQPEVYFEKLLYKQKDVTTHGGNLVMESSPCYLNGKIYFTSGSGYVFGYNPEKGAIDWEFFIGSDMDGSAVVTSDSCLLIPVEKQYITGNGGVFKLDPSKTPDSSVVWYFPVKDAKLSSWEGGVIGSPAVNDATLPDGFPHLAAVHALDSNIYVIDYTALEADSVKVWGPNKKHKYRTPKLIWQKNVGPSISTPIFVGNKLVTTGYWGVRLFQYNEKGEFKHLDHFPYSAFESTPVVHDGKLYIGGKTGYLYCLGEKEEIINESK